MRLWGVPKNFSREEVLEKGDARLLEARVRGTICFASRSMNYDQELTSDTSAFRLKLVN